MFSAAVLSSVRQNKRGNEKESQMYEREMCVTADKIFILDKTVINTCTKLKRRLRYAVSVLLFGLNSGFLRFRLYLFNLIRQISLLSAAKSAFYG